MESTTRTTGVHHQGVVYLTGVSNELTRAAHRPDLGLLGTPAGATWRQRTEYPFWAADNGCFVDAFKPGAFDADKWLAWLAEVGPEGCLFATLPDVVGKAHATWSRSINYVDQVRALGFPVATVAQNGVTAGSYLWDEMLSASDAIFIGGSPECTPCSWVRPADAFGIKDCPLCGRKLTEWKLGDEARELVQSARAAHRWVHVGRVNSYKRLSYCDSIGADSADGTYLKFGRKADRAANTAKMFGWLDTLATNREGI